MWQLGNVRGWILEEAWFSTAMLPDTRYQRRSWERGPWIQSFRASETCQSRQILGVLVAREGRSSPRVTKGLLRKDCSSSGLSPHAKRGKTRGDAQQQERNLRDRSFRIVADRGRHAVAREQSLPCVC